MFPLALLCRRPQLPEVGHDPASSRARSPRARVSVWGAPSPAMPLSAADDTSFSLQPRLCLMEMLHLVWDVLTGEGGSLFYVETMSHSGGDRMKGYTICPSLARSGFHKGSDQKLNHVTGNSSATFSRVYDTRTDSHSPINVNTFYCKVCVNKVINFKHTGNTESLY